MTKRILSLLLGLLLVLSLAPVSALAEEGETPEPDQTVSTEPETDPAEEENLDETTDPEEESTQLPSEEDVTVSEEPPVSEVEEEDENAAVEEITPAVGPVMVVFACDPAELVLTVYDKPEEGKAPAPILPEEDGAYLLLPGEYLYTAAAEGYIPAEEVPFTVEASEELLELFVTLTAEPEPLVEPEAEDEPSEPDDLIDDDASDGSEKVEEGHPALRGGEEQKCGDNLYWSYDADTGTLTITGSGEMYSYGTFDTPWSNINSNEGAFDAIKRIVLPQGLTSIGSNAFFLCRGISSVSIPDSVTEIGDWAFSNCISLLTVVVPRGITTISYGAFAHDTALESITIPDGVTTIGDLAFYNCTSLQSADLPSSVTSIGMQAFSGCNGLTSFVIPDGATDIGNAAFRGCEGLRSITIPDSLINIGNMAFSYCSNLSAFSLGEDSHFLVDDGVLFSRDGTRLVTYPAGRLGSEYSIPDGTVDIYGAFAGCSQLTSIAIPNSITDFGWYAFSGCSGLTSITIPSSVVSVGEDSFYGCTGLEMFTVEEDNAYYSSQNGLLLSKDGCTLIACPMGMEEEAIILPGGITTIGRNAFGHNGMITDFVIPNGVTCIEQSAFNACSNLRSITIPESLVSIEWGAFNACSMLKNVYYLGTRVSFEEKLEANIVSEYNTSLLEATWHFTSDDQSLCGDNLTWIFDEASGTLVIDGSGPMYDFSYGIFAPWDMYRDLIGEVILPAELTSIGANAFYGFSSLSGITITDNVISIGDNAFSGCINLTELTIPDGVISLGVSAFDGCMELGSITLPNTISRIEERAFFNCYKLTDVYYGGTEEQRELITISPYYNDPLLNAVWHYVQPYSCGDNLTWSFDEDTGTLIISGFGAMEDYIAYGETSYWFIDPPWASFKEEIKSVSLPDGITNIGDVAFYGCTKLTSVVIPDSVDRIGNYAFCECSGLSSVIISNGVTSVCFDAFFGCSNLTSVFIPESLTDIGGSAFGGCSELNEIIVDEGNNTYKSADGLLLSKDGRVLIACPAGKQTVTIPNSVNSIEAEAFSYCTKLTTILIPCGVSSIGYRAFIGCEGLTTINIPNSVTEIGEDAFSDCSNLTEIVVSDENEQYCSMEGLLLSGDGQTLLTCPGGKSTVDIPTCVVYIGDYAFSDCQKLTSVTIPNSVVSIGMVAFYHCLGLTSITIPNSVVSIGYYGFYYCTNLASITIPNSVSSIGEGAFGCCGLTSVIIPGSVSSISDSAFCGNPNLTSVIIQNGVDTIGKEAFCDCENLESVTIPSSVIEIEEGAFAWCDELANVYYLGTAEQRSQIGIGSDNDSLLGADWHFVGPLAITVQPADYVGAIGETAIFHVEAEGEGLTYQWQWYNGFKWADSSISGNKTATASTKITATKLNYQYRCVITDSVGNIVISNSVRIVLPLSIVSQPEDFEGAIGETAIFTVVAQGQDLTYQWQWYNGTEWADSGISGNKTATASTKITQTKLNYQYRCVITDALGNTVTSEAVRMILRKTLEITAQPVDYVGSIGETATFHVEAEGEGLTYQWQWYNGSKWADSGISGNKTATASTKITQTKLGYQYRCVITDALGDTVTSEAVRMILRKTLEITAQPVDYVGSIGETATFHVEAEGDGLTYQWQWHNGTEWANSGISGNKTATASTKITRTKLGYQYRCVITDRNGNTKTTDAVRIILALSITAQPTDYVGAIGETATFHVEAEGEGLTYQWQWYNGSVWADSGISGNKTATASTKITRTKLGYQYRCVITDRFGNTKTTNAVRMIEA